MSDCVIDFMMFIIKEQFMLRASFHSIENYLHGLLESEIVPKLIDGWVRQIKPTADLKSN